MDRGNVTAEPASPMFFSAGWRRKGPAALSQGKLSFLLLTIRGVVLSIGVRVNPRVFLKDSAGQTSECYSISLRLGSIGAGGYECMMLTVCTVVYVFCRIDPFLLFFSLVTLVLFSLSSRIG